VQSRFQCRGSTSLVYCITIFLVSTEEIRQFYPVWCSRLRKQSHSIDYTSKSDVKIGGLSKFWGRPDLPTPSGCAHADTPIWVAQKCNFVILQNKVDAVSLPWLSYLLVSWYHLQKFKFSAVGCIVNNINVMEK